MYDLFSLPTSVDAKIRIINAKWIESRGDEFAMGVSCCREAYDVLAEYWGEEHLLSDYVLENDIPSGLFRVALSKRWVRAITSETIAHTSAINAARLAMKHQSLSIPAHTMVSFGGHEIAESSRSLFMSHITLVQISF